jgi:hypothetical protein
MGEHEDDEERSGRPSVVSYDLVQSVDQKTIMKDCASQLQNFHVKFHKFNALFYT